MAVQNATTYFSYLPIEQYILLQSLYLPIGVVSIFGNSLVLLSYLKYKKLRNIECAHLIAGLSVGDLIAGIGSIILGLARLETAVFLDFDFSRFFCIFTAVPNQFGLEMSQSMIVAIAIDRLYAVFRPFMYRKRNHRRYAAICFVIALLSGGVILVMSVAGVDFSKKPSRCGWTSGGVQQISIDIFVISNALIGPIVAAIYAAVVYKERKWHLRAVGGRGDTSTTSFLAAQAKMTAMLARLVVIYCILVAIPLTTLELWRILNIFPDFTSTILSPLRNVLMSLNSAVNVVVYVRSSSSLRPFLLHLLSCKRVTESDLDRGHDGVTPTPHSIAAVPHTSLRNLFSVRPNR